MPYTRKQVVTCVSILYLILVTALSGYAASRANYLSIPIPNVLSGFTTALPIVAGFLLEGGYDLTRRRERRRGIQQGQTPRPPLVIVANTIIFIYSSVVITLLGTHAAPPSGLNCRLDERWRSMFTHKKDEPIRAIQEAFKCCGFMSTHDKAWPFPDKNHGVDACEKTFGRTTACHGPWRQEEQRLAGILMAVVGLVFVWQFAIIATPTRRESWLHQVLPDRVSRIIADEEQGGSDRPRRAIDYLPNFNHYSDRGRSAEEPIQVSDSDEEEGAPRRATGSGVQQVRNALPGTNNEQERHAPTIENEWARN